MIGNILGLDLGTSAVKVLGQIGGKRVRIREPYAEKNPAGWWQAICRALRSVDTAEVTAIGLSSQVGTYIVDGREVIPWDGSEGKEETENLLASFSRDCFLKEISMPHPRIVSYPIPRIRYIRNRFPMVSEIAMPKDWLCRKLTGNFVSDTDSWRGLANRETGAYSPFFIRYLGAENIRLPLLLPPCSLAGYVTERAAEVTGLKPETPVFVGCNDFYSGLLGMGICEEGRLFDVTGTSEHLGSLCRSIPEEDDGMVCSGYFFENVRYGVTASGGCSLEFGMKLHDLNDSALLACLDRKPPVFLPYLHGERAPVWDPDARGVFFGLSGETGKEEMAYAVLEGVAFSLRHMYEALGKPPAEGIIASGGASANATLNRLKASLLSAPLAVCREADTSALGAILTAAVGQGRYPDPAAAIRDNVGWGESVLPEAALRQKLMKRYAVYKELYPQLKPSFSAWKKLD